MITRTGFLGGLLVFGAAALPVSLTSGDDAALPGPRHNACAGGATAIASDWGATGAWRSLAPYPVPREATPTNSVGTWVERWHLPNGVIELRRVSASETEVATLDVSECVQHRQTHRRSFAADSMRGAFTDASLDSLMRTSQRGLIYVWSPRMPLSVRGLQEARQAARELGITFIALVAETNEAELDKVRASALDRRRMESLELVYRNATIHYPAVLLYSDGHIVDGVFPGYKNRETYAQFAKRQFQREQLEDQQRDEQTLSTPNFTTASADTAFWVDRKARVTTLFTVNTLRRIGFFFKPITGTSLISYTSEDIAYFFDLKTNKEQLVPGHVDPVPTPDGRFLTLPGLHFHPIPALLAGNQKPVFTDRALPDEYQTASILSESRNAIRYRIVTGWHAGARFRDYDAAFNGSGVLAGITAVGEPFVPCADRTLTLPINAKSGREFGAYDVTIKSNVILEVVNTTACKLKLDLGFASGKLSFSYDGAAVAFATSRINTDATGALFRPSESFYKDALVLFRKTGRIVSLSQNVALRGMTFPEFQKDGTVMLLDQVAPGRPVEQMRVVSIK